MEGFLTGFAMTPKPLKGVESQKFSLSIDTLLPIKQVLKTLTTQEGLSSWLGETSKFLAHVGIKFEATVADKKRKCIITALDIPRAIVLLVEGVGEFRFGVSEAKQTTNVFLVVTWALSPEEISGWQELLKQITGNLETALKNV